MKQYDVAGHVPSYLPEGSDWKLVWHDEFDGTELDTTKWDYRLYMMCKRHPTWVDDGVTLDGESHAVFHIFERDGEICSSQLQTGYNYMDAPVEKSTFGADELQWNIGPLKEDKFAHKYGYYECRCKMQTKPGWWSAFWLQSPIIGSSLNPGKSGIEVDIMESFCPNWMATHCLHWSGYGKDHQSAEADVRLVPAENANGQFQLPETEDGWHTFAVDWSKDGYTFYVDGQFDGSIPAPVSHTEQFILLTTEVHGYRHAEHRPTKEAYDAIGDKFIVDYVRVFDRCPQEETK